MVPTDDQLAELVKQKFEHAKHCQNNPTYDLTRKGRIKLICTCGWCFAIEADSNSSES